jgi:glycosyltransferase involved in cell wall biosynthesis
LGVPLVYSSEYSAKTECEIIDTQTRNPILRLRRKLWIRGVEKDRLEALRHAAGIQCSGTPTYDVYGKVHPNALLFFDNRVRQEDVIDTDSMAHRCRTIEQGRPLRLAFGGRLIAMKGVADLPSVARALAARGIPFTMDIYGSGDQEPLVRRKVSEFGLGDHVRFRGVLDFQRGWIPTLKSDVDLFICCHPQGDPSSTYPEVMSCGVPIAGYDNDAFKGIVEHSKGGWLAPMQDPDALAAIVARLHAQRAELVAVAKRAKEFAAAHTFERTFARRARHLLQAGRNRQVAELNGRHCV